MMYRANRNAAALTAASEGWCLTPDETAAGQYGRHVASIEIDLSSLMVEACEGYDHQNNETPADDDAFRAAAAARGVDVLRYEDATETGRQHTTYRLVSDRAVAACRIVSVTDRYADEG